MKRVFPTVLLAAAMAMGNAAAHEPVPELSNAVSPEQGVIAAGRIGPGEVAALRDAGFHHVIDLTPDAETPGFDEASAVRAAGLRYSNLPLAGASDLTRENVLAFDTLLAGAERPLLVHCASGNRVGAMAALRAATRICRWPAPRTGPGGTCWPSARCWREPSAPCWCTAPAATAWAPWPRCGRLGGRPLRGRGDRHRQGMGLGRAGGRSPP